MDQMSDEELSDMMSRATRLNYDSQTGEFSFGVSQVFQDAAEINSLLWCEKYLEAGYDPSKIDEDKMLRAIAIEAAAKQMVVMAQEENQCIEIEGVYKHLPVYVDGSNVYILPRVLINEAESYAFKAGSNDFDDGVKEIFKAIINGEGANWSDLYYLKSWVVVNVDNDSNANWAVDDYVLAIFDRLGGGDGMGTVATNKIKDYLKGKIKDKILDGLKDIVPNSVVVGPAFEFMVFYAEFKQEYLKMHANQMGQEAIILRRFCEAFYVKGTFISFTGPGYTSAMQVKNVQFDSGNLQIAVAAYNQYNDGADIDINWIYNYNDCTDEQKQALDNYVEWVGRGQNDNPNETISSYRLLVSKAYNDIMVDYGLPTNTSFETLTPAQFKEVQNYMADPENYLVDTSLWE